MNVRKELTASATYAAVAFSIFLVVGFMLANVHGAPFGMVGFVIGLFLIWPWFIVAEVPAMYQSGLVGPVGFLATYLWAFGLVSLVRLIWRKTHLQRET
jgi:hypothetical protein